MLRLGARGLLPPRLLLRAAEKGWFKQERALTAPPAVDAMLRTLRDVAAGMAYLHERDIIHRDLTGGCTPGRG